VHLPGFFGFSVYLPAFFKRLLPARFFGSVSAGCFLPVFRVYIKLLFLFWPSGIISGFCFSSGLPD